MSNPIDRFGMIDPASGHEPLYFGKVNDVEDYAIAGEQYVRLSDYATLRAENEALRARLETVEADRAALEKAHWMIVHTFTEDSHGNTKTMPASYYQDISRRALSQEGSDA